MKNKIKYWTIFNQQLDSLKDNEDIGNSKGIEAGKGWIMLTPIILITACFQYLWLLIFKRKDL